MKTLFLASQIDKSIPEMLEFVSRNPKETRLCFIPTAGNLKKKKLQDKSEYKAVLNAGFKVETLDIEGKTISEISPVLDRNDVVLISGGNTFYLLQEVRRNGFDKEINRVISEGKKYVGSSAGSVILGPDIAYIDQMDNPAEAPELAFTKGLSEIPISIVPHRDNPKYSVRLGPLRKKSKGPVVNLRDGEAIVFKGSKREIVGS
ncbi:peptidase [Patescibacteria group bacterium]|nr:peptidase [Patescibacteria group bacterium]